MYTDCDIREKLLAIRIPGRTVGDLILDENNIITDIDLCTGGDFPLFTKEQELYVRKKFVGTLYDFELDEEE